MDPRREGQRVASIYTIQRPQPSVPATTSLSYDREPRRVGHRPNNGYSNRAFVPETRVPHPGLAPPPYDDFPPVYSPVYDDVPRYSELDAESGRRLARNNRPATVQRVRQPAAYIFHQKASFIRRNITIFWCLIITIPCALCIIVVLAVVV